jgi:hypothetical protein
MGFLEWLITLPLELVYLNLRLVSGEMRSLKPLVSLFISALKSLGLPNPALPP